MCFIVFVSFPTYLLSIPTHTHTLLIKCADDVVLGMPYICNASFRDYKNLIIEQLEWCKEQNMSSNPQNYVDVVYSFMKDSKSSAFNDVYTAVSAKREQ